jgi:hypothetical protein
VVSFGKGFKFINNLAFFMQFSKEYNGIYLFGIELKFFMKKMQADEAIEGSEE